MRTLSLAAALLAVVGCEDPADAPTAPTTEFAVDDQGLTFTGEGDFVGLVITVPPAAVVDPVNITVQQSDGQALPSGGASVGPQFLIGPAGLTFQRPVIVRLPFDPELAVAAGSTALGVKVWRVGPNGWEFVEPASLEPSGSLTIELDAPTRLGAGVWPNGAQ